MEKGKFEEVSVASYLALASRIEVSKQFPDLFYDKKALEADHKIPYNLKKDRREITDLSFGARYYNIDKMVLSFIEGKKECNLIYLGAGFETSYFRLIGKIKDTKANFYEIDLPEVAEAREKAYGKYRDDKIIAGDIFDLSWADQIENKDIPSLIICAGVFQYYKDDRILKLIRRLKKRFPNQQLIIDCVSKKSLKQSNRLMARAGHKRMMTFGIDDPEDFAMKANIDLLEVRPFFKEIREYLGERVRFSTRFLMKKADEKKLIFILRFKLKER